MSSLFNAFRLWGGATDGANAPMMDDDDHPAGEDDAQQEEIESEDHEQQQPQQQIPLSIDAQLWQHYLARIQPDITPSDPRFQAQLAIFHAALRDHPIETVLQTHFAEYDVWRFVQGASRRSRLSSNKKYRRARALQDRDTAAYKQLLMSSPVWRNAAGRDTLAFKCTMMYFGLPVQPMLFRDSVLGPAGTAAPAGWHDVDDDGDDDDTVTYFVPEEMRPLRFLNHYQQVGHGKDNSHMSAERAYELFYTIPMTLRGGGAPVEDDDDDDQDSVMHDLSDDDDADDGDDDNDALSIRGGDSSNATANNKATTTSNGALLLWGFAGRTTATFSHGLGSFFAAVDRLLGLRTRSNAGITVAILGHPHGEGQDNNNNNAPCKVLWEGQCLLGNRKRETEFLATFGLALRDAMDSMDDKGTYMEWKVCVSQISQDKHFKDAITTDSSGLLLSYKPSSLATHHLASFSLAQEQQQEGDGEGERGALAYLFLPPNVNAGTSANHYQEWFRSLWRTLGRPNPAAEEAFELGSSAVLPHASCLLQITIPSGGESTDYFLSDVGPSREIWEWLVEAYHVRGQREFLIGTRPLPAGGSLVHIPGYFRDTTTAVCKTIQDVINVAMESIPDEQDRSSLESFLIRPLTSGGGFLDEEGAQVLCQDSILDPAYLASEKRLQTWLQNGYTLHVQPRWPAYVAKMLAPDGAPLVDPKEGGEKNVTLTFAPSEPWTTVLARIRATYTTKLGLPCPEDAIIRIDQRIVQGHNRNQTRWDLSAVDTSETTESWSAFVFQSLTTRQMTLQLCGPHQSGAPSDAAPFALREQQPDKYYWGCHDRADDMIALYEGEEEEGVEGMEHPRPHPHPRRRRHHLPESATTTYPQRTTGWENPNSQAKGANDLPVDRQGLPVRNQGLDFFQRGRIFREWSYGHPLSIHMDGQYPEFPVNAPPLELLLKVPGPEDSGGVSDSVPVLSTQLLTATEQRRLQEAFFRMRSLALGRVQECPWPGCWKYFGLDEDGSSNFQKHLKTVHVGKQCPFCQDGTVLLDNWAPWQIAQHFLSEHVDQFSHKGDLRRDLTVAINSKGLVHAREEQFKFCPRCGRNHAILDARADRAQHDNLCFPGNASTAATSKYCVNCGKDYIPSGGLYPHKAHEDECQAKPEQREEAMHCHDCGLPVHEFSRRYAHKHVLFCKGAACKRVNWCPWCGIDLTLISRVECHSHLDTCAKKPYTGRNPIDTNTGEPLDSPRDTAEIRRRAQHFTPRSQYFVRVEVPKECPIRACTVDLSLLNAHGLWQHFYDEHTEATNGGKACPLCHLDFQARGWALYDEKKQHMDDHIERREKRILGDMQVSKAKGRGDPALREGLEKHDDDKIDLFQQLVVYEEELTHARNAIIDMQNERREEQQRLAGPSMTEEERRQGMARLGRMRDAMMRGKTFPQEATTGVSEDSGEAGPSRSRPQPRPARRPARDGTYRPDRRRRPSDDDDDYREGEVPEPQPDLDISPPAEGRRKRARDTTATETEAEGEAGSSEAAASAGSSANKKPRTEGEGGEASGSGAVAVEVISDGSSGGESGLDTPSSRSENEGEEEVKKRSPGRPRVDKGKGKAVAVPVERRSSPRITRSHAVHEEDEEFVNY